MRRSAAGDGAGLRAWACIAALACAAGWPRAVRADAGVWDAGPQAMWISTEQAQLTVAAHLGLADAWAWHAEGGVRFNAANLVRPEVATGVTWVYDVFAYVPAVTLAVGMVYPDAHPSWLGLARVELRRFVTPRTFAAVIAGVEGTHAGWEATVGIGLSWTTETPGAT